MAAIADLTPYPEAVAMLRALAENPHDYATAAVFADWLEEHYELIEAVEAALRSERSPTVLAQLRDPRQLRGVAKTVIECRWLTPPGEAWAQWLVKLFGDFRLPTPSPSA